MQVIEIPKSGKLRGSSTLSVCGHLGRPVIFKTEEFPPGSKVVFIPPGYIVDLSLPEFEWLPDHGPTKIRRFFGKPSYGFFVPAPEGAAVGDDVYVGAIPWTPPPMRVRMPAVEPTTILDWFRVLIGRFCSCV